jgi:glycerophosphoryl diester phosphodiesterase
MLKRYNFFIKRIYTALNAGLRTSAPYAKLKRPLSIAHRGLAGLFPENTKQSFKAALYSGADLIELDVVFTKDDHLLVMHDPYLRRLTNI